MKLVELIVQRGVFVATEETPQEEYELSEGFHWELMGIHLEEGES